MKGGIISDHLFAYSYTGLKYNLQQSVDGINTPDCDDWSERAQDQSAKTKDRDRDETS